MPAQFDFLREKDEYRINNLTKMLFEKYGFKVFFDTDQLPDEITDSNCDKLYADVISSGNFIRTKSQVILKDCKKNTVYKSVVGTSKEKEYKVAYTQALRGAFSLLTLCSTFIRRNRRIMKFKKWMRPQIAL